MDNLLLTYRRLTRALVALVALCASFSASALTCQQSYDEVIPPTSLGTFANQSLAQAACEAKNGKTFKWLPANWTSSSSDVIRSDECRLDLPNHRYVLYSHWHQLQGWNGSICANTTSTSVTAITVAIYTTNTCAAGGDHHTDWAFNDQPYDDDSNPATPPVDSGFRCYSGCTYEANLDIGTGDQWYEQTGSVCDTSPDDPTPAVDGDDDGDGTPNSLDAFPDDPLEDTDSDGDGVGDNNDVADDDPTNGDDDGTGNEIDNSASGGGTCAQSPQCTGDGIACATLYQTWATRCAVEALDTVTTGGGGGIETDVNNNGRPDWTEDDGAGSAAGTTGAGSGDVALWHPETGDSLLSMLDTTAFLSKSCPALPQWDLGWLGTFDPTPSVWCDLIAAIGAIIMLFASIVSIRILMG